jgi:Methyltransferase domain
VIEGWLTEAQAKRLAACASRASGTVVEIGSFRGRSTVVLASVVESVVAIDPHGGGDRGPQEIAPDAALGEADFQAFHANLAAAGVAEKVRHLRKPSADAHADVVGQIALLFVDGAHRFVPARDDIAHWGARVAPGGTMLVHDAFSSVGVTGALFTVCSGSRTWRYVGRTGSLAEYQRRLSRGSYPARAADAVRHVVQLPWFARNLAIKVLVLAGRRRWAERLGLDPAAPWPY